MAAPTFDEVAIGIGDDEQRFSFEEFCRLPLPQRVELLMRTPRYYREGELLNSTDAMRFG